MAGLLSRVCPWDHNFWGTVDSVTGPSFENFLFYMHSHNIGFLLLWHNYDARCVEVSWHYCYTAACKRIDCSC